MTDTHDSYLQSDARQEAISAQKELFLRGLPVDTTVVSDFVLRSWQRSRLAGVDPKPRCARRWTRPFSGISLPPMPIFSSPPA